MRSHLFAIATLGLLAGCAGGIVSQPPDPAVTARIVQACTADGVFKMVGGRLVLAVLTQAAAPLIAAGVDQVCADPARFSGDLSTAEWVAKNLAARL